MRNAILCTLLPLSLFACGPAPGTLTLTIYGEEFIEEGIPADEFKDGWALKFTKFLVSIGAVSAARGHGAADLSDATYRVFDLSKPSATMGQKIMSMMVPGGAYDHVGYKVFPPPQGTQVGNASAADKDMMIQKGYSIYLEAEAEQGAVRKTLKWGFTTKTAYGECESEAMIMGTDARSQITIHADHLFYDDLFAKEPGVRFELVASADKDGDGEVTLDEIKAVDITKQERYQVGSTGIKDLRAYIEYQTGTVGHIDGEGHCAKSDRE